VEEKLKATEESPEQSAWFGKENDTCGVGSTYTTTVSGRLGHPLANEVTT
jgi:hypothetical protein